jgi:copper transport protein
VRVGGLGLVLAGLPRVWTARGGALVVAGGVVALVSFLLSGHTAASEPRALVLGANLVHTGAAAVWFGGLVLLALVLRRGAGGVPAALAGAGVVRRFSSVALVSVAALAVAGLALAWVEVRSLEALVTTAYGWTLLAKVALAGVVVALGAYNRTRLVDRVSVAGERAWATLAATVRVEAAALVAVLGITAVLVALVPARTAAGVGEPFVDYLPLGPDHEVNLVIDPARTGSNEFHLYLLDGAGRLADVGGEVTIRLSLPAAGIAPIEREPFVAGPGHWVHIGSELSIPGAWQVEVQVLVSDFERLTAVTEVDIGGRAR